VSPKTGDFSGLSFELFCSGVTNVLDNLSEISHVELVMELESSGSKLRVLAHVCENHLCGSDNLGSHLLDVFIEIQEVSS